MSFIPPSTFDAPFGTRAAELAGHHPSAGGARAGSSTKAHKRGRSDMEEATKSASSRVHLSRRGAAKAGRPSVSKRARRRPTMRMLKNGTATKLQALFRGHMLRQRLQFDKMNAAFDSLIAEDTKLFALLYECETILTDGFEKGMMTREVYDKQITNLSKTCNKFRALNASIDEAKGSGALISPEEFAEQYEEVLAGIRTEVGAFVKENGSMSLFSSVDFAWEPDVPRELPPKAIRDLSLLNTLFDPRGYKVVTMESDEAGNYTLEAIGGTARRLRSDTREIHDPAGYLAQGRPLLLDSAFFKHESSYEEVNGGELVIPMGEDQALVFTGTFRNDPINLHDSSGSFRKKNAAFVAAAASERGIPSTFKKRFLQTYAVRDFILKDTTSYVKDMREAYAFQQEIDDMSIFQLPMAFLHAPAARQIKILNVLLMQDDPTMGFFLFSILQENIPEYGSHIKECLHYTIQQVLSETETSFEEMKKRIGSLGEEDVPYEARILASKMDDSTKARALKMAQEIKNPHASDASKMKSWLDGLLRLPLGKFTPEEVTMASDPTEIASYMRHIQETMDGAVYGHEEAKSALMRVVGQWIANGGNGGEVIALQGPPGNGKTTFAKEGVAKALNRPFCFIPIGGATDSSFLLGHDFTYVGSKWGHIAEVLIQAGSMNPVIYIDELDKISQTAKGEEIIGVLTHLMDSSQNSEFHDKYFDGIDFDLSKALFIVSYNDEAKIDPILKDRMITINTSGLSAADKRVVANHYLMPSILKSVGMEPGMITITDEMVNYLVENYTHEAGVRRLKEALFAICRELNLERLLNPDLAFPIAITEEVIHKCIKEPRVHLDSIPPKPTVGSVNGLYATVAGGGGLTVMQTFKTVATSRLELELTGSQGDVMQESMHAARTVAWNLLPEAYQKRIMKKDPFGLHVHAPSTSMPKDGPSAGGAITTSMISQLTGVPVRNDIAMTGEIDIMGRISAIGGLEFKLIGAKKAGVRMVLAPKENAKDLAKAQKDFPELFADGSFEVVLVDNIHQVLELALMPNDIDFQDYSAL